MNRLLIALTITIILNLTSCSFNQNLHEAQTYLDEQTLLITGIKLNQENKDIYLIKDFNKEMVRGSINTKYSCTLLKGDYESIWESDKGLYFLSKQEFLCEDYDVGGIFYNKENNKYYTWIYQGVFKENVLAKIKTEKFVENFKKRSSIKPLINLDYIINPSLIEK